MRQSASVGTLATKSSHIAGQVELMSDDQGDRRAFILAYDKATREEVGALEIPAP